MSRVPALALLAMSLLLTPACATGPKGVRSSSWRFPESYRATQVVTVFLPEAPRDFLASVKRSGSYLEVVLFDPALQVPLVSASHGDGPATETIYLKGVPNGNGLRLAALLDGLHQIDFELGDEVSAAASGGGWRFTLSDVPSALSCRFPRLIEVEPMMGGPRIRVETTDVSCGPVPPVEAH
jgi:hypothetical protein